MAIPLRKLKEYVVLRLKSRFKSRIRARLYRLGIVKPRPSERLILDLIQRNKIETFLQIGVNDGQYADPLNLAIHLGCFRLGTLVEPQPAYFKAARGTYRGIKGLEFVNNAISNKKETLTLYTFDIRNRLIPAWVQGSASLSRDHVLRVAGEVPNIEQNLIEIPVEAVTVQMLFDKTSVQQPDIIVVDAEGFDAMILRQFDFRRLRPKLVLYESDSMLPDDKEEMEQMFVGHGFKVVELGQDSAAIHIEAHSAYARQR